MSILLQNTAANTQTVTLTFQLNGGTARRLARLELDENQQALVRNIPVEANDTVLGVATDASSVDYLVLGSNSAGFGIDVYDATGTGKGVSTLRKVLLGVEYLTDGELADPGN